MQNLKSPFRRVLIISHSLPPGEFYAEQSLQQYEPWQGYAPLIFCDNVVFVNDDSKLEAYSTELKTVIGAIAHLVFPSLLFFTIGEPHLSIFETQRLMIVLQCTVEKLLKATSQRPQK